MRLAIADGSDNLLNSFVWLNNFSATDFSPSVNVSLSDTICSSISDFVISLQQDSFEVDIDSAYYITDIFVLALGFIRL